MKCHIFIFSLIWLVSTLWNCKGEVDVNSYLIVPRRVQRSQQTDFDDEDFHLPEKSLQPSQPPEIYSFHIESNIRFRYSRTHITSRIVNRNSIQSSEARFHVILPETAFISKFLMEIDGKVYESYVKEKEEAKRAYQQAQSAGQSAGLVEQVR